MSQAEFPNTTNPSGESWSEIELVKRPVGRSWTRFTRVTCKRRGRHRFFRREMYGFHCKGVTAVTACFGRSTRPFNFDHVVGTKQNRLRHSEAAIASPIVPAVDASTTANDRPSDPINLSTDRSFSLLILAGFALGFVRAWSHASASARRSGGRSARCPRRYCPRT
jgi:hypothetical protein